MIFNTLGNEVRFEAALDDLQRRGLLQRDLAQNRYDLHPIVRRYAYDRLTDKMGIHTRLKDYFANIPAPDTRKVQSVQDLAPIIELYHHTVRAGRYDEACDLLEARLIPFPLHFRFGAYQLMLELLRGLFPDGEGKPPRLKEAADQSWALLSLANVYPFSGQLRRAVPLYERQRAIDEQQGNKENLAVGLGSVASTVNFPLGELALAELNYRRAIAISIEIKEDFSEAVCRKELGLLLAFRGEFDEATQELNAALNINHRRGDIQSICLIWTYRAVKALLARDAEAAFHAAQQAQTLASVEVPFERDIIRSEWLLGAACVMGGRNMDAAYIHLTDALTRCRRINLVEVEPDILLTLARWHHTQGNAREAQEYAEESLVIADRCEYRLAQAEIRNFLARVALDGGRRGEAREHAEAARERAWCDGPPHCYRVALDEAEGMLRELGVSFE